MISQQAKIMITLTKSGTLQARVIPGTSAPPFEITIGGNEWMAGKGSIYHQVILEKATELVNSVQKQLAEVVRERELQQPGKHPAPAGETIKKNKAEQPDQERRLQDRRSDHIPDGLRKRGESP